MYIVNVYFINLTTHLNIYNPLMLLMVTLTFLVFFFINSFLSTHKPTEVLTLIPLKETLI